MILSMTVSMDEYSGSKPGGVLPLWTFFFKISRIIDKRHRSAQDSTFNNVINRYI